MDRNWLSLLCKLLVAVLVVAVLSSGLANGEKSEEEKEKYRQRYLDLSESFKQVFWREKPLDPSETLQLLTKLNGAYHGPDAMENIKGTPMDTVKLLDYADVNEAKCAQPNKVLEMRNDYDLAKEQFPALLPYMSQHFIAQFELCGFHVKYKEDFKNFKEKHSRYWGKMSAFKDRVAKFGKISKGKKLDNPFQFNDAFNDLYEEKKKKTRSGGLWSRDRGDAAIDSYNEAQDIREGSELFKNEVSPSIDLAMYHPDALKDDELRDGLRHNNVYNQYSRTNFERSMSPMFADAFYDKDDRAWTAYQDWSFFWQ